jgi:AcrR family transcriptional regulator
MIMASLKVTLKRKKVQQDILQAALPYIESGKYNQLTIREFCNEINITTGMFYRCYKTKNDLLAFYAIETSKMLFEASKDKFSTMSLREKLLQICLWSVKSLQIMGPDSLFIYLNIDNPECSCDVSRQLFLDQIKAAFDSSYGEGQYSEDEFLNLSNYLIILDKGISFEWYSRQDDPEFDLMKVAESCFNKALNSFNFPENA